MANTETREIQGQLAPRQAGVEQRREEHVAGDAGEGVEVEYARADHLRAAPVSHFPRLHARLIKVASAAAPKPLSMFTTPTFGAQLFSIPSSAATPPKDAP